MSVAVASKLDLLLALTALIVFALPAVSAGDGVTVAGQCYNQDGSQGGEDYAEVDTDTVDVLPNLFSGHGAIEALVLFATQTVADGQPSTACKSHDCASDCDTASGEKQRFDYLMVEARALGIEVQACYDKTVWIDGHCPERPTGPA